MIRIAITAEAYEAIARTLALGDVGYEVERAESQAPSTSTISTSAAPSRSARAA
jgi:hypothetical protein